MESIVAISSLESPQSLCQTWVNEWFVGCLTVREVCCLLCEERSKWEVHAQSCAADNFGDDEDGEVRPGDACSRRHASSSRQAQSQASPRASGPSTFEFLFAIAQSHVTMLCFLSRICDFGFFIFMGPSLSDKPNLTGYSTGSETICKVTGPYLHLYLSLDEQLLNVFVTTLAASKGRY